MELWSRSAVNKQKACSGPQIESPSKPNGIYFYTL